MQLPRLRHNIAVMGALQGANYLISLLTLPYLTRVMGVEEFGRVSFVQAVMALIIALTDLGFSWSATRSIAVNRDNRQFVSRVFAATWAAQWCLAIGSILVLSALVPTVTFLRDDASLYYVGFGLVIGNVLLPLWLLQGLERMREVALIQLIGRVATLPLLFMLVKTPNDAVWAVASFSAGPIVAGIATVNWIYRSGLVERFRPSPSEIGNAITGASVLFLSKISMSIGALLPPIILGVVAGTTEAGYFGVADRVRRAVQALLGPISQALYPRMTLLFARDREAAQSLVSHSVMLVIILLGSAGVGIWVFADWIVRIIAGPDFGPAAGVLRCLAFLPLLVGVSNVLGIQVLLPNNFNAQFTKITSSAALLSVAIVVPLSYVNGAKGAAIAGVVAELYVCLFLSAALHRLGYRTTCSSKN